MCIQDRQRLISRQMIEDDAVDNRIAAVEVERRLIEVCKLNLLIISGHFVFVN